MEPIPFVRGRTGCKVVSRVIMKGEEGRERQGRPPGEERPCQWCDHRTLRVSCREAKPETGLFQPTELSAGGG